MPSNAPQLTKGFRPTNSSRKIRQNVRLRANDREGRKHFSFGKNWDRGEEKESKEEEADFQKPMPPCLIKGITYKIIVLYHLRRQVNGVSHVEFAEDEHFEKDQEATNPAGA